MPVTFSIPYNLPNVNQGGLMLSAWFAGKSLKLVLVPAVAPGPIAPSRESL
jgi:hypothetical protein